ncbi:MAG: Ig-like domain-containing protein [Terracidiphilus sp.]
MQVRFSSWALLPAAVVLVIAGCTNPSQVDSISVSPPTTSLNTGQTIQLTATGTFNHAAPHPPTQQDLTSQVSWTTNSSSVATVSRTGQVTAVTGGTAIITASINGFTGLLTSSSTITVTNPNSTTGTSGTVTGLQSLTILPASISIGDLQGTGEFLAIATFTDGTVKDVTNSVTWISDAPNVFPISTNGTGVASSGTTPGIVTAYGSTNGSGVVIIAELTDPNTESIVTATAQFACPYIAPTYNLADTEVIDIGSCNSLTVATDLLSTLTVYDAGLDTTDWLITAASATGTPDVIHCGPGSQFTTPSLGAPVCTATYPSPVCDPSTYPPVASGCVAVTVTPAGTPGVLLEARQVQIPNGPPPKDFGGWSYNCVPSDDQGNYLPGPIYFTQAGPNYCVAPITLIQTTDPVTGEVFLASPNVTVGAIFN